MASYSARCCASLSSRSFAFMASATSFDSTSGPPQSEQVVIPSMTVSYTHLGSALGTVSFLDRASFFDHQDVHFRALMDQLIGAENAGWAGTDDDDIIFLFIHVYFILFGRYLNR